MGITKESVKQVRNFSGEVSFDQYFQKAGLPPQVSLGVSPVRKLIVHYCVYCGSQHLVSLRYPTISQAQGLKLRQKKYRQVSLRRSKIFIKAPNLIMICRLVPTRSGNPVNYVANLILGILAQKQFHFLDGKYSQKLKGKQEVI